MKKTIAALAVLSAFAGSAIAADVTLYGRVDLGLRYTHADGDKANTDATDKFEMASGNNTGRTSIRMTDTCSSCGVSSKRLSCSSNSIAFSPFFLSFISTRLARFESFFRTDTRPLCASAPFVQFPFGTARSFGSRRYNAASLARRPPLLPTPAPVRGTLGKTPFPHPLCCAAEATALFSFPAADGCSICVSAAAVCCFLMASIS